MMKRIALLLLLMICTVLLSAVSFDDVLDTIYSTGLIEYYNGEIFWVSNGFLGDESQANAYVAWAATIILYVRADWELSSHTIQVGQLKAVKYVSAYWHDDWDDCSYLVSIPMSEVVGKFNSEYYHKMDFGALKDSINDYVTAYGTVRPIAY